MEKNCAFQYCKISGYIMKDYDIVCDKSELTLDEAKELWNKYFSDCANHIKNGGTAEMVIWINMKNSSEYNESLEYISTNAESDGVNIWETKKTYFKKQF